MARSPKSELNFQTSCPIYISYLIHISVEAAQRVGVGLNNATLDGRRNDGYTSFGGSELVGIQSVGGVEVLVDDAGHTVLAVVTVGLGAVVPDGLCSVDNELEDIRALSLLDRHEAAEERFVDLSVGDTGGLEAGLRHRVVLG